MHVPDLNIELHLPSVAGIVGLAADPDFTENLLMRYLPKPKIKEIFEKGVATISWGRVSITRLKRYMPLGVERVPYQLPRVSRTKDGGMTCID